MRITNCGFVSGDFLHNLKSSQRNNLKVVDFKGSYQIEFEEIVKCIENNWKTVRSISVDGENVQNDQFMQAIAKVVELEDLRIYFG